MLPYATGKTTATLGAPKGWNEAMHGPCGGLPVVYYEGVYYSYWKMSWLERLKLLCGAPVRLSVVGTSHPPVHLTVGEE